MNEIQERVDAMAYLSNLSEDMKDNLFNLVAATSDLCREYNSATRQGKVSFTTNRPFEMALARTFHFLILVANAAGIDLEKILDETLKTWK